MILSFVLLDSFTTYLATPPTFAATPSNVQRMINYAGSITRWRWQ